MMLFARYSRTLFRKTQMHQKIRHVVLIGFGGWIFLRNDFVQLCFGVSATRAETVVPNIERLERSSQAFLNQLARPEAPVARRRPLPALPSCALREFHVLHQRCAQYVSARSANKDRPFVLPDKRRATLAYRVFGSGAFSAADRAAARLSPESSKSLTAGRLYFVRETDSSRSLDC